MFHIYEINSIFLGIKKKKKLTRTLNHPLKKRVKIKIPKSPNNKKKIL